MNTKQLSKRANLLNTSELHYAAARAYEVIGDTKKADIHTAKARRLLHKGF